MKLGFGRILTLGACTLLAWLPVRGQVPDEGIGVVRRDVIVGHHGVAMRRRGAGNV